MILKILETLELYSNLFYFNYYFYSYYIVQISQIQINMEDRPLLMTVLTGTEKKKEVDDIIEESKN